MKFQDSQTQSWLSRLITTFDESLRFPVPEHGRAVEAKLARIQAAGMAAIHNFEEGDAERALPIYLLSQLESNKRFFAEGRKPVTRKQELFLTSVSSAPTQESGKAIDAFFKNRVGRQRMSYVFDVSPGQRHDLPIVPRAMETIYNTGTFNDNKHFCLHPLEVHPELMPFYESFLVPSGQGINSQYKQELLLLNAAINDPEHYREAVRVVSRILAREGEGCMSEQLLAATPENLAALTKQIGSLNPDGEDYAHLHLFQRYDVLGAALSGLAHARDGVNLPVTAYQVTPYCAGRFHYLAQGEEESLALAHEMLAQMHQDPAFDQFMRRQGGNMLQLREDALQLLGADIKDEKFKTTPKLTGRATSVATLG